MRRLRPCLLLLLACTFPLNTWCDQQQPGGLKSLLSWAVRNSAEGEAPAQQQQQLRAQLPSEGGGVRATPFTASELAERRAHAAEALALFESLPSPAQLVASALAALANATTRSDAEAAEAALLDLAELAEPVDTASDFGVLGATAPLVEAVRGGGWAPESRPAVRSAACLALGVAASNNPAAGAALAAAGAAEALVAAAVEDGAGAPADPEAGGGEGGAGSDAATAAAARADASARCVYALSSLGRGPGAGQEALWLARGGAALAGPLAASPHRRVAMRAMQLAADLAPHAAARCAAAAAAAPDGEGGGDAAAASRDVAGCGPLRQLRAGGGAALATAAARLLGAGVAGGVADGGGGSWLDDGEKGARCVAALATPPAAPGGGGAAAGGPVVPLAVWRAAGVPAALATLGRRAAAHAAAAEAEAAAAAGGGGGGAAAEPGGGGWDAPGAFARSLAADVAAAADALAALRDEHSPWHGGADGEL